MAELINSVQHEKGFYFKKAEFIYRGTAALKKGRGMCFDLDYANSSTTGEKAADPFGTRGLKEIQVPSASNANRFAGILTMNLPANPNGHVRKVQLYLPGACAMVSQRIISTVGLGRITCIVDSTAGDGNSGLFAYGGLPGRGSAVPLQTLVAATSGNLAISDLAGGTTAVYSSATGLTTISLTGAGTALGYDGTTIAADGYEMTVLDGATAATGAVRANPGVYPVVNATGTGTFTVLGDTGSFALTICLTKKDLLMMAYLEDGEESGLSEYVTPKTSAARQFILNQGGTTFVVGGGITIGGDSTVNTLADPITIGGSTGAVKKAFNVLSTITSNDYIVTVTSGFLASDTTSTMQTIVLQTAKDEVVLEWYGNMGGSDAGRWVDQFHVGASFT